MIHRVCFIITLQSASLHVTSCTGLPPLLLSKRDVRVLEGKPHPDRLLVDIDERSHVDAMAARASCRHHPGRRVRRVDPPARAGPMASLRGLMLASGAMCARAGVGNVLWWAHQLTRSASLLRTDMKFSFFLVRPAPAGTRTRTEAHVLISRRESDARAGLKLRDVT